MIEKIFETAKRNVQSDICIAHGQLEENPSNDKQFLILMKKLNSITLEEFLSSEPVTEVKSYTIDEVINFKLTKEITFLREAEEKYNKKIKLLNKRMLILRIISTLIIFSTILYEILK